MIRIGGFLFLEDESKGLTFAAPYQGGAHHVNEQPMLYWIRKFEMKGYEFRDVIRPDIWDDSTIATCYRQNLAMFVRKGSESYALLDAVAYKPLVDVIHPDHWKWLNVMLQGRLGRMYRKIERLMAMLRSSFGR